MSADDIPQIKPGKDIPSSTKDNQNNSGAVLPQEAQQKQAGGSDSILIPKLRGAENSPETKEDFKPETKLSWAKRKRILLAVGGVLALFIVFMSISSFIIYKKAKKLETSLLNLVNAVKQQDLELVKKSLDETKDSLSSFQKSFKLISWTGYIPLVGGYTKDASHALSAAAYGLDSAEILIDVVEPYADIIGFVSQKSQDEVSDGQKTTQERIEFIVKTIPDVVPRAGEIEEKVNAARDEINKISPSRYPVRFAGKKVRERIIKAKDLVNKGADLITNGKPLLEAAPYLLGIDGPRTYLVVFQNDKELRPTGGFITAYSIAKVEKGKFEPVSSNDIYNLDSRYKPTIKAPEPIIKYIKGPYVLSPYLRLRDMNWSPDFYESMKLFTAEVEKVGIKNIDGVIAVDTELLVNLLDVLGPIGVSGFGNFSTEIVPECNCPQVIYELESFADIEGPIVWSENEPGKIVYAPANYDNRKKIIGPLMNSILANAMGQPKDKLPALFEAAYKSLVEKHVLFYLFDAKSQTAVESFGIAGRIKDFGKGDYLHINDANLGGRKSNLYVQQEVSQEISIAKDGTVEKTVTITYKNPMKHDGWLNSVLPNWVRVYVPKGSELIDFSGVQEKTEPYEEFGKTVFAGFFELRPQGIVKVTLQYKLPFRVEDEYKLFIQKQPGTANPLYSIEIGKKQEEFFLKEDKELRFGL